MRGYLSELHKTYCESCNFDPENDMFYAVVETRHLRVMMQEKFKVLDDARKILVNGRIHITFSIGVGFGANSLEESEKFAHQSLDMAFVPVINDSSTFSTSAETCAFSLSLAYCKISS